MRAQGSDKRPLLIMNNGSDGGMTNVYTQGGAAALARGYDVLLFDGPGQGHALWHHHLFFRYDWEKVITPVVERVLTLPDIDPDRIAILGISQGGYWVPRALAFEKRIAAGIADPGVVNVASKWNENLPEEMMQLLRSGDKQAFDDFMKQALPADYEADLRFRMRPYGSPSYFDVFTAVQKYDLTSVAEQVRCPLLVTDPDHETFWPGHARLLADMVRSSTLMRFTKAEGADLHCEVKSMGLRDLHVFDWLDDKLGWRGPDFLLS